MAFDLSSFSEDELLLLLDNPFFFKALSFLASNLSIADLLNPASSSEEDEELEEAVLLFFFLCFLWLDFLEEAALFFSAASFCSCFSLIGFWSNCFRVSCSFFSIW